MTNKFSWKFWTYSKLQILQHSYHQHCLPWLYIPSLCSRFHRLMWSWSLCTVGWEIGQWKTGKMPLKIKDFRKYTWLTKCSLVLTSIPVVGAVAGNGEAGGGDGKNPEDCQTGPHLDRYWTRLWSVMDTSPLLSRFRFMWACAGCTRSGGINLNWTLDHSGSFYFFEPSQSPWWFLHFDDCPQFLH